MKAPPIHLSAEQPRDIQALAQGIDQYLQAHWQVILNQHTTKLADAYARGGDMAYGTYLGLLLRPVHRAMKDAGLQAKPQLPGDFEISREWGNADETEQERWMWSTIHEADNTSIGTLVTVVYHDHTRFYVPQAPTVFALCETDKKAIITELSRRSADFRQAREAHIEIAEYLKLQKDVQH
jgi:hypothetical protein